jgi:hypothetical protein
VDSELALLPLPKAQIDAYYPNPLFRRTESRNLFDVDPIVVGRLDGPSYELARSLIDHALQAEEEGIAGRAYIDIGGPHPMGDEWFESLAEMIEEQGFDLDKHSETGRLNLVDRFDEPLFYFGWYSGGLDGPFTHYDFKFPPGAIALHLHSFTAASVRSGSKYWVGPLVARGVTATFGNTSEPYLFFTHQPHLVVEGLFKGLTVGEAALYSNPGLSWAGVFIGDPLYLPPLDFNTSPKNEYAILRSANFARMAGDSSAYKAVLSEHERTHHFSTGLWLFDYFQEKGDPAKAYEYLASSMKPSLDEPKLWGVLVKFAEACLQVDHDQEGIGILQNLLDRTDDKREVRLQLLNRVLKYTQEFELSEQGELWQKQLDAIMPPEDKKSSGKN